MTKLNIFLAAGISAVAATSVAHATTDFLTEGSGWHYGESHAQNSTAMYNFDGSGGVFTLKAVVTREDDLSFVDGFIPGDKYAIKITLGSGSATYNTQFLDASNYDSFSNLNGVPTAAPSVPTGSRRPTPMPRLS